MTSKEKDERIARLRKVANAAMKVKKNNDRDEFDCRDDKRMAKALSELKEGDL